MKTQHALLALTLWLSACAPVTTTGYPAPPTTGYAAPATPSAAPSALPTTAAPPTETPVSEATPTATAAPEVWEIWFSGFSCEGGAICDSGPGIESAYFSIRSDGTGLTQLQISDADFKSGVFVPPDSAPPTFMIGRSFPTVSPDGLYAAYFGKDGGLYIIEVVSQQTQKIYVPMDSDGIYSLGPFCWSQDSSEIVFMESTDITQPVVINFIDKAGQNLRQLFSLSGLQRFWFGACSPDGRQMVLTISSAIEGKDAGLFLINLDSGDYRQILANYSAWLVRPAP